MDEDIRMRGMLYQYQHRFGKKWKKVWCVLSADSLNSAARLELYEFRQASLSEGLSGKRSEGKKVILLRDCVQIAEKECADCPKNCGTFQMETTSKLFTFAAQAQDVQSWVKELCRQAFPLNQAESRLAGQASVLHPPVRDHSSVEMKENSLYETASAARDFLVIAMGTDAALRCKLYGEYILTPQDDRILLKDHKTKKVILSWPYCFIRKFGQDKLSFSFEAGRRCETGEGNFEFTTNQGDRIFKIVSAAIQTLPQSEKPGSKPKPAEKVEPVPQSMEDTCVYSTVNHTPYESAGQEGRFSPGPKQRQIKKLTPTFRSLSLNAIEPPNKGQVRNINSCPSSTPSSTPHVQEPLYATVAKPRVPEPKNDQKSHWQGINDYLHQLGPLPDPLEDVDYSPADETGEMLQDDLLAPSFDQSEDYIGESIYSEPKDYDGRAAWEASREYHLPEEILGSRGVENGGEEQAEGFSTYDNLMSRGKRL
ncbi:docking protein 3 [Salminus brasiliensis]|uniref:docking protein 3 n=1 Tax=Salminus brasiliensis TaxID=930266 RepID=UPI003B82EE3E